MTRISTQKDSIALKEDDSYWRAVTARDRRADGRFVYAVRSTGIYCRPWCPSRRPNRANVEFFNSPFRAEASGYRACRKCRPQESRSPQQEIVIQACRFLSATNPAPTLGTTAAHVGLSSSHFHRLFSKTLGITPRKYAGFLRDRRFRSQLKGRARITEAVYASGFESSSRCYSQTNDSLGMTPTRFRNGGNGLTIRFEIATSSLGRLLVAATDIGLCLVEFGDSEADLRSLLKEQFHAARLARGDAKFREWVRRVVACVDEPRGDLGLPMDIQGTVFQCRVWQALRDIPIGTTVTYQEIARLIGRPKSVRAVANACAANRLAVVIPCHRVTRTDGGTGGYKWGRDRKVALQEREADLG